jgi:hypothetical protein
MRRRSLRRYLRSTLIRVIVLATLLNVAVITASFRGSHGVSPEGDKQPEYERHDPKDQKPQQEGFWPLIFSHSNDISTSLIAIFNGLLVFVTYRLVSSTNRLWEAGERQIEVAADSAKAAHRSADVAERTLEQTYSPYLDIVVTPKATIHRQSGGAVTAQFDSGVFAEYTISNYGSSPAIVLEIYHGCVKGRGIPNLIGFPPPQSNLHRLITVGGSKASEPISVPFPLDGWLNVAIDEIVWVGIQIRYRDIFGEQYITNSWFTYSNVRASFVTYGGPKYNNRRKLTDEERQLAEARDIFD